MHVCMNTGILEYVIYYVRVHVDRVRNGARYLMSTWKYVYSTLANRKERNSIQYKKRVGYRVARLENWGSGLNIFCCMPTCILRTSHK